MFESGHIALSRACHNWEEVTHTANSQKGIVNHGTFWAFWHVEEHDDVDNADVLNVAA